MKIVAIIVAAIALDMNVGYDSAIAIVVYVLIILC